MTDRGKTWMSLTFFASAFLLPLAGLIAGWIAIDFQTGLLIAGITFGAYFLAAAVFMATVKHPSWFAVWLPYLLGIFYTILPDFMVGPLDDACAVLVGSTLTFFLWLKKQPDIPRWIVAPLIGTTVFVLIGGFIPGPFDELIFTAILSGIALIGGLSAKHSRRASRLIEIGETPAETAGTANTESQEEIKDEKISDDNGKIRESVSSVKLPENLP